jgi:hypothetical protein
VNCPAIKRRRSPKIVTKWADEENLPAPHPYSPKVLKVGEIAPEDNLTIFNRKES